MSTFQLDKNTSDRRLVGACREEGHGDALPLPGHLHDATDVDLVRDFMVSPSVFVTLDRRLPQQCAAHIPDANPGIVVVTNYPQRYQTLTSGIVLRLLSQLKARIPLWYDFPLNNSVLEVTAEGVGVGHVERGVYVFDGYFQFTDAAWPGNLRAMLQTNALRAPRPLPGS